jgi:phage head maturation protease
MGNTQLHKDTLEMVERGDWTESSFKYRVGKGDSTFTRDSEGNLIHTVKTVRGLYDVSIVGDGAFSNTDINVRSAIDEFEKAEKVEKLEQLKEENKLKTEYIQNLKNSL